MQRVAGSEIYRSSHAFKYHEKLIGLLREELLVDKLLDFRIDMMELIENAPNSDRANYYLYEIEATDFLLSKAQGITPKNEYVECPF